MKQALVVLLLLIATAAHAGNGISSLTVSKHRSLTSVAIKVIVAGDDDSSAVLRIFQKWTTSDRYDTGMVLVRRPTSTIHEGRILWMTPGRTAQFYIEAVDATSGTQTTAVDTVSCAEVRRASIPTDGNYYLNQTTGNNANDGLSAASPKKTFITDGTGTGALSAMLADDQPGTGIYVLGPLHSHEKLTINTGTDGYHHFIMGSYANAESTFFCGANALGEVEKRDATNNFNWAPLGSDSIYVTTLAGGATSYGDSIGSVTVGWGEWLMRKTSLKALMDDSTGTGGNSNLDRVDTGGWWWHGDSLYVKRKYPSASPSGISMHIGYKGPMIDVRKRNWRFSRLTVRWAGGPITCRPDMANDFICLEDPSNSEYQGIAFGTNANASGGVVDSCKFYGNSGASVLARYSAPGQVADSVTVANCSFDGLQIGSNGYAGSKGRIDENAGGIVLAGKACNAYRNTITEVSNGIQLSPVAGAADTTWAQNDEIAYNTITRYNDDGFELDATHGLNMLIVGNKTVTGSSGISHTTMYGLPGGPVFIIGNSFLMFRSAGIKIGDDSRAACRLYQNTFASLQKSTANDNRAFEGISGGGVSNVTAWNNIFMSPTSVNQAPVAGPDSEADTGENFFNYNLISGSSFDRVAFWGFGGAAATMRTLAQWRTAGMEANGIVAGPQLYGLFGGSAQPTTTSPVIGAGRRITGVNTSLNGNRYLVSPFIGSTECSNCGRP